MPCVVDFIDNSAAVLAAFRQQVENALEQCGMLGESGAKGYAPVDTGNLRNSITHTVQGDTAYIGTNTHYAPYIEFGTGIHCTLGGGRNTPWKYEDRLGNWHTTTGRPATPYLKPGVADHAAEYKALIENALKN